MCPFEQKLSPDVYAKLFSTFQLLYVQHKKKIQNTKHEIKLKTRT